MSQNYGHIIEENSNLKRALASSKQIIEKTANEYETLKQIHEDYKIQGERMKRDNDELHSRNINLINDKKELENQFDSTIRNLKVAIEQKQREIEEIQAKVIPTFDHDMLRIKIINELEIPHKQELDKMEAENDKLNENIYEYKKQIEILTSKIDIIQKQNERQEKIFKERHQLEVNEYIKEIQELTDKIDDNRDKELIRKYKREAEEAKYKAQSKEIEAEELRQDRDKNREEKNENLIKYSKQLEQERNDKRLYKSETEKLSIRARFLEEEVKKNKIRIDSFNNEVEITAREKDQLSDEIRKKDDMIHQLQRRIAEVEEEHVQSESRNHEHSMKVYNDEHEKFLEERNKNIGISREFEQLRKQYDELSEENKTLRQKISKDLSTLRQENMQLSDENNKIKRQLVSLTKDNEEYEKTTDKREKYINEQEREIENLRKKYRDTLNRIQSLEAQIEDQQIQLKNNVKNPYKNNNSQGDMGGDNEDVETLRKQNQKLKAKLKEANAKIVELLQKRLQNNNNSTSQMTSFNQTQQQNTYVDTVRHPDNFQNDDQLIDHINKIF